MSKTYTITLLPGDGIGPEVIAESVKVLDAVAEKSGFALEYTTCNAGGAAIDAHNDPSVVVEPWNNGASKPSGNGVVIWVVPTVLDPNGDPMKEKDMNRLD